MSFDSTPEKHLISVTIDTDKVLSLEPMVKKVAGGGVFVKKLGCNRDGQRYHMDTSGPDDANAKIAQLRSLGIAIVYHFTRPNPRPLPV